MTDIGFLVRTANPVPDDSQALTDDKLDAVFLLATQRSTDMDTREQKPTVAAPARQRGWLVAAAAFAAVVVLVGAAWLIAATSRNSPPATTPPTTEAAAPTTEPPPEEDLVNTTTPPDTTTTTAPELDLEAVAFINEYADLFNRGEHRAAADALIAAEQFDAPGETDEERAENSREFHQINSELGTEYTVDDCRTLSSGITQCRLARSAAEIEAHHPHPETSLLKVRLGDDGTLAFAGLSPIQTDPWWLLNVEFTDWAVDTYETSEAPFTLVFVDPDPETYPTVLEELVTRWRSDRDE